MTIVVSDRWTREQAKRAADHPIAKARASGKPVLVAFGSGACCGPDMTLWILEEIERQYGNALHVIHADAAREPLLAARYQVRSVPALVFYDSKGKEIARRTGNLDPDEAGHLFGIAKEGTAEP
jgi:thioredoxin-like negative regulator of GroEL